MLISLVIAAYIIYPRPVIRRPGIDFPEVVAVLKAHGAA
jgi:hypothetical protein